ncbi:MAG: hypothetical protein K2G97_03070 [Oscillospiraceae bacterium]|nr:hypothetical protein [Oscillospiraceae bacterium]
MSCGCNGSGNDATVFAGIDLCREGINICCQGLNSVRNNNVRNGIDEISNGICLCLRGIRRIRRVNSRFNRRSSVISRALRRCCQELSNINFGCCEIARNNIELGVVDVNEAICAFEQSLNVIEADFENGGSTCNNC